MRGGGPSQTNQFVIKRGTNVRQRFVDGEIPQDLAQLEGNLEPLSVISQTFMATSDVFQVQTQSGGGDGDPPERDPERVFAYVQDGVVAIEGCRISVGVVVNVGGVYSAAPPPLPEQLNTDPPPPSHP